MKKKPSKSKAERRPARKPARRVVEEFQLDIFGGRTLVARRPTPTKAEQAASAEFLREAHEYFASEEFRQFKAREAAAKAQHRERLEYRPAKMRARNYRLPDDVRRFLDRLYRQPDFWPHDQPQTMSTAEIEELLREVYVQGCTQGYIEGRVVDLEPRRKRAAAANAAKRRKPREHNGMRFTLDQRDAAIVAEFTAYRPMMGATEAQLRLAEKYDLSDKMIRIIIGKARKASR
jgi:hypothetical protein